MVFTGLTSSTQLYKSVKFPLDSHVAKPQAQELLHAAEELYFFHRYGEAVEFIRLVFSEKGRPEGLDEDVKTQLRSYEAKCLEKASVAAGKVEDAV